MAHLRSSGGPPEVATWAMVAAHNSMTNVGGYSPMQWAFGRNMTERDRLYDGPDLPLWSGLNSDEKMQRQLQARLDAEQRHREMTYQNKINQAYNTKMQSPVRFQPGDLVYYKRYQVPQDKQRDLINFSTCQGEEWPDGLDQPESWRWKPRPPMMDMCDRRMLWLGSLPLGDSSE